MNNDTVYHIHHRTIAELRMAMQRGRVANTIAVIESGLWARAWPLLNPAEKEILITKLLKY
jgi:hypothetical protein